ncbi:alpha/beta hydrolase [Bacillus suaedaesalsae]|uniref:Alpha/beta hydrolase n=1 Tax=Bacillus suaedaesalsae TaxID=2810349 RepID=A0ABS2DHM9_9BACI|nr:alpha/beta hydrolase-fold protein [Bacillus suaedaesalsae]MBM6617958.1 alpha/beta hydrolase [Bacillus suaedaesalsae]
MIENFEVPLFGQKRKIRIFLPHNYADVDKKYPVLYMHDGQNVFDDKEAIGGVSLDLHTYLEENRVEIIVIAIDQNTFAEERINEYCPFGHGALSEKVLGYKSLSGGKGNDYVDFIVQELKPFIDSTYRTEITKTYMAGISLGGLISTYAACRYPNIFKRVAAISSAFYRNQESIEELLKTRDLSSLEKFYLDYGTTEAGENTEISHQFELSNQAVYEIVKEKITNVNVEIIKGGKHNYATFKERVPQIITYITS